jgi:hypothetical protein
VRRRRRRGTAFSNPLSWAAGGGASSSLLRRWALVEVRIMIENPCRVYPP